MSVFKDFSIKNLLSRLKRKLLNIKDNEFFYVKGWDKISYIEDLDIAFSFSSSCKQSVQPRNNYLDEFFSKNDFLKINENEYFCYFCKDVILYPGLSEIIYTQDGIYLARTSNHKVSYNSQEFCGLMEFDPTFEYARIKSSVRARYIEYFDSGIDLTYCINNYWHVLVEVAPKAMLANDLGIPINIPLLLPDNLHKNFIELIKSVCGNRDIVFVSGYRSNNKFFPLIRVKELYSINNYYSWFFHPRKDIYEYPMYSEISLNPLKLTIDLILERYCITPNPDQDIKLIVVRNSAHRVSSSQDQLVELALERGYIIFEPEKLSFEEQIRLTSRASSIVGFFGAALSNALFMHPSAKKILIGNPGFYSVASFWVTVHQ